MPVHSALAGAILVSPTPTAPSIVAHDADAFVRAVHADAFVAIGGGLGLELVPVEVEGGTRILISQPFDGPSDPLDLGDGWLVVRDGTGKAATFLLEDGMSVEEIALMLNGSPLAIAAGWAEDREGNRLIVQLDHEMTRALERPIHYIPAESVSSDVTVRFMADGAIDMLYRDMGRYDVERKRILIDGGALWHSAYTGPLVVSPGVFEMMSTRDLPGADGWRAFDQLARFEEGPHGWQMTVQADFNEAVMRMTSYAGLRRFRTAHEGVVARLDGRFKTLPGAVTAATAERIDLSRFGIAEGAPPANQ
jgi:hypothetical protein